LWSDGGGLPGWAEFVESGQGMGATLTMADQMNAYVLTDQGTYLRFKEKVDLVPLSAAAECLRNPYSVIVVNPEKHRGHDDSLAQAFVNFLVSPSTQALIGDYQLHGEPLFHPLRLQD
jgi:tungstate transport system substrate-binding protein